jgi:hypothetical protein
LQNATHAEARAYVGVGTWPDILALPKPSIIRKLWTLNNGAFARSQTYCASWDDCPDTLLTYIGKDPSSMEAPSIRTGNESLKVLQPRLAFCLGIQPPAEVLRIDSDRESERLSPIQEEPIQEETAHAERPDEDDDPTSRCTVAQMVAALARRGY